MSKITISGATGYVGQNIAKSLAENGFEVVALARNRKKVGFGRTLVSKDLTEKSLEKYARGSVALLHLIGIGRQSPDSDFETINVGLIKNAISLCKRAGIKKLVYLSGLGASANSTSGYFISKFKAEQEIIRSGLDYTIFRPSYIIGEGDQLSRNILKQAARGSVVIVGSGRYRFQPISVSDVSRVVRKSISERHFSRKIIELVGPKAVTYERFVRDLVGPRVKIRHLDFEKAYHDAMRSEGSEFGVDDLGLLVGDYIGDHKRLARISEMKFAGYDKMLQACRLS